MIAAAQHQSDSNLIERARIAYLKAGGVDQPSDASEVKEINGVTTITLRNLNGVLAMYRFDGAALKRAHIIQQAGAA